MLRNIDWIELSCEELQQHREEREEGDQTDQPRAV